MSKRAYLGVNTDSGNTLSDPVKNFARSIRLQYGGTETTEKNNIELLEKLIYKNYISKASIIWTSNNTISKIYGIKVNADGTIQYHKPSPEKKRPTFQVPSSPELDLSAIQHSIQQSQHKGICF